jgi:protein-glutamine gamma-glutamyltransferase
MGEIIESPAEVMRVRLFEGVTEQPYPVHGELYFYGTSLGEYHQGQWNTYHAGVMGDTLLSWERVPKSQPYVRVEHQLQSIDRSELFFIPPYIALRPSGTEGNFTPNNQIIEDRSVPRLLRPAEYRRRQFNYRMGTTVFRDGQQLPLRPLQEIREAWSYAEQFPERNGKRLLPALEALAKQWTADSGLPAQDIVGRARFLENRFAHSGLFKYSLDAQQRDPNLDPIEDFVSVHRAGHCEYFATALTLMLRSQGIPARMVVGFKTDEWNDIGQCYQVRQLHAHAWVEVKLDRSQIPEDLLHGQQICNWNRGAALRLDPTPAGGTQAKAGFFAPLKRGLQWLDFAWSYYVVELNYERQRKAIFTPIASAATTIYNALRDPATWRDYYGRIAGALRRSGAAGVAAWLLFVLAIIAALSFLAAFGWLTMRTVRWIWRRLIGSRLPRQRRPKIDVEFYRRLEYLLAKAGLRRPLGQTPGEFAELAGVHIAAVTGESRLAAHPPRIVDAYYRVRFGRLSLDRGQSQDVEEMLAEIQRGLAHHGGKAVRA